MLVVVRKKSNSCFVCEKPLYLENGWLFCRDTQTKNKYYLCQACIDELELLILYSAPCNSWLRFIVTQIIKHKENKNKPTRNPHTYSWDVFKLEDILITL